jgi:hypothetical protein
MQGENDLKLAILLCFLFEQKIIREYQAKIFPFKSIPTFL